MAELNRKRKRRRVRDRGATGQRRTDNDPLQSYDGDNVTLDGVADEDGGKEEYSEFFDDTDNDGKEGKQSKKISATESKVFVNTADGTGKSTAGRNAWKEKHKKGKFSKKRRKNGPRPTLGL